MSVRLRFGDRDSDWVDVGYRNAEADGNGNGDGDGDEDKDEGGASEFFNAGSTDKGIVSATGCACVNQS